MSALSERPPDLEQFRLVGRCSYELTHSHSKYTTLQCNSRANQSSEQTHCVSEVIVWQFVKNLLVIDPAL